MDSHPIIICEECGKKYRVDTGKILGQVAGFSCRSCGHRIRVARPQPIAGDPSGHVAGQRPAPDPAPGADGLARLEPSGQRARRSGISLQAKALLIWFIVPAAIAAATGFLFLDQTTEMISLAHRESFFMLLLIGGGFILSALVIGLWFGLKLAGRIRRLAEAAEGIVSVSPASGDELGRLEKALARVREIVSPPGAGSQPR